MKKFVTFDCDWADEFSVYGFRIFTPEEWDVFVTEMKRRGNQLSYGFGTNESWDNENAEFFLSAMEVNDITDEDATKLISIFALDATYSKVLDWGHFPSFDSWGGWKGYDASYDVEFDDDEVVDIADRDEL